MRQILGAALFLVIFGIALRSLCPGIFADDSPETTAAFFTGGITHAPGDPLLQAGGALWAKLPLGGPGIRVNALAALLLALFALGLWNVCAASLTRDAMAWTALGLLVLICLNPVLRQQAAVAKGSVYLSVLLLLALIARTFLAGRPAIAALLTGLLFSHHWMTLAAISPVLLAAFGLNSVRSRRGFLRSSAVLLACFALGASLWLILPVRSAQSPAINVGAPATAERFATHFSRKAFSESELRAGPKTWIRQFLNGLAALIRGLTWPGLALAIAGALSIRRRMEFLAALGGVACPLLAASLYLDLSPELMHLQEIFLLPCFLGLAYLAASGISHLAARPGISWRLLAALCLVAVPLSQMRAVNLRDVSRFTWSFDMGRMLLSPLPPGAGLVVASDLDTLPLWYHQSVERFRPDVLVVNRALLRHGWYREQLMRAAGLENEAIPDGADEALRLLLLSSERDWFSSATSIPGTPAHWLKIPHFLTFRLSPWFHPRQGPGRISWRGTLERIRKLPSQYSQLCVGYVAEAMRNIAAASPAGASH